jgi:Uma2 family endonuclease
MALQIQRRLFSIDEYERMIASGVFPPDDRSELIRGEIVEMAPIGLRHAACVARIQAFFSEALGRKAIVWVQNPVRLLGNSLPQPDLALLKPRDDFYEAVRPMPSEVFLVVEVSDSTVAYDTKVKVPLYAEAGIPQVWIVNLQDNVVAVYSSPASGTYASSQRLAKGQSIPLSAPIPTKVEVDEILG